MMGLLEDSERSGIRGVSSEKNCSGDINERNEET